MSIPFPEAVERFPNAKWQMTVIMGGMFAAFYFVLQSFPNSVGFAEGVDIAGKLGKMNVIDLSLDPRNRYTLFSGLTGGLFLFVSYFGTDQSQVQRYLGGKTLKESRLGLMFNGILKIPMQFFILMVGIMVFVSFQFNEPPIIFNTSATNIETQKHTQLVEIEKEYKAVFEEKKAALLSWEEANQTDFTTIQELQVKQDDLRKTYKSAMLSLDSDYVQKDSDYIFLTFVLRFLPHGLIGLLLAVIFSAAMSSTAGELNALASTTTIDYYKKFFSKGEDNEKKDLRVSRILTVCWGFMAIIIALTAGLFENLIQLVNILGSLFYGTILGVFLLAFFFKKIQANAAFTAGIVGQAFVLIMHLGTVLGYFQLSYLLYNIIGSTVVVLTGIFLQNTIFKLKTS
ncbi:MAG: hypothetical protein R2728_13420 [Chitinophagales bacterium]